MILMDGTDILDFKIMAQNIYNNTSYVFFKNLYFDHMRPQAGTLREFC